jgi:hypothetical protein
MRIWKWRDATKARMARDATICKAWKEAGLAPFNPEIVLIKRMRSFLH